MNRWAQIIAQEAQRRNVDPNLALAVTSVESNFRPDAVSPAGAIGLMQLMPTTAKSLGVDPHDPIQNIRGGVDLLSQLLKKYKGNVPVALAAYNAGEPAVDRYGGKIPPFKETRGYVPKVMKKFQQSDFKGLQPQDFASQIQFTGAQQMPQQDPMAGYPQFPQPPQQQGPRGLLDRDPSTGLAPIQLMGLMMMAGAPMSQALPAVMGGLLGQRGQGGQIGPKDEWEMRRRAWSDRAGAEQAMSLQRQADKLAQEHGLQPGMFATPQQVVSYMQTPGVVDTGYSPPQPSPAKKAWQWDSAQEIYKNEIAGGEMSPQDAYLKFLEKETGARTRPSSAERMRGSFQKMANEQLAILDGYLFGSDDAPGGLMSEVSDDPKQRLTADTSRMVSERWLQNDPRVAEYVDFSNGSLVPLIKALGDSANVAVAEQKRAIDLLPKVYPIPDRPAVAKAKIANLRRLLSVWSKIAPIGLVGDGKVNEDDGWEILGPVEGE